MDTDKNNPPASNGADDLHAEGIDIVGTSMAFDNEYSKPESGQQPAPEAAPEEDSQTADYVGERDLDKEYEPAGTTAPTVAVASIPKIPATETPTPAPVASSIPEYPRPTSNVSVAKDDPSIKPIRTFKTDAEEAVRYGNVSKVDIAIAEEKKREASTPIQYETEKRMSPGIYVLIAAAIAVLLSGGWYYWFTTTGGAKPASSVATVSFKPIISYSQVGILPLDKDSESSPLELAGAKLASANPGVGNVFALVPVETATSTVPAPIAEVLKGTHIPNRLARSLGSDYMIGLYSYDRQGAFIIFKDTFYQNAYAGMLEWEKDLGSDLLPFIRVSYPDESIGNLADSFQDAVISNIDVRTLKNTDGETALAYAFADKDTIVIATGDSALKYALDRILQVRTIQ